MLKDPARFKAEVIALAGARDDQEFIRYVNGVTDRMWHHVVTEEGLSAQEAEERLFQFYEEDKRFFKG
ncbi:hypothetical protein TheveDRAFT_0656 [Thermanaerovibrio velox DSM 12556]|uniref:Uncharacterized protein n=1 Tax=Thermanaerovibrio velox DSM 12556 TaxID=926567 RepID=H0UQY6_9BACT|nr:hypothetical protein [Thermanaerovibrio velox]EHM09815.1 hypothetical protein TheveDRAFT_0656 [Thermanaerovibrio velox DSM 12556]